MIDTITLACFENKFSVISEKWAKKLHSFYKAAFCCLNEKSIGVKITKFTVSIWLRAFCDAVAWLLVTGVQEFVLQWKYLLDIKAKVTTFSFMTKRI